MLYTYTFVSLSLEARYNSLVFLARLVKVGCINRFKVVYTYVLSMDINQRHKSICLVATY